jgi:hypothetical protein
MAVVSSRQGLIDHCLRRLGYPVIEINVDDDQIEDRVDDALQFYQEYHSDATSRIYYSYQFTQEDLDNAYITLPDNTLFVIRALPITQSYATSRSFFDIKYQLMLNDMAQMGTYIGDLAYYEQMQQYISLLDRQLSGMPQVSFRKNQNRLLWYSDMNDEDIRPGNFIVLEMYIAIDPQTHTKIYNDMFIKDYTTQLIKQQWGANLIKFDGMQLPGGVTLNGRQLYDDATGEIDKLRENMRMEHELPPDFFVG